MLGIVTSVLVNRSLKLEFCSDSPYAECDTYVASDPHDPEFACSIRNQVATAGEATDGSNIYDSTTRSTRQINEQAQLVRGCESTLV